MRDIIVSSGYAVCLKKDRCFANKWGLELRDSPASLLVEAAGCGVWILISLYLSFRCEY